MPQPRFSRSPNPAASIGIEIFGLRPHPNLFMTKTCFLIVFSFYFQGFLTKTLFRRLFGSLGPILRVRSQKVIHFGAGFTSKFLNGTPVMPLQRYRFDDIFDPKKRGTATTVARGVRKRQIQQGWQLSRGREFRRPSTLC